MSQSDHPRITEDVDLDSAFQGVRPDYEPPAPYDDEEPFETPPDPRDYNPRADRRPPTTGGMGTRTPETGKPEHLRPSSRIPDHAPRPQDHKAPEPRPSATPVQNEAEGVETISMEYDGMTFSIPADPLDWPIVATEAFENGKLVTAVKALIGDTAFARLVHKGYRNKDFGPLFDALAELGGFKTSGN